MEKLTNNDYYYIFILGYDLLQNYFKNCKNNECDIIFNKALNIYKKYKKSEEFDNHFLSGYDSLKLFLENNNYIK